MDTRAPAPQGVAIFVPHATGVERVSAQVSQALSRLGGIDCCRSERLAAAGGFWLRLSLGSEACARLCPGFDTLALRERLAPLALASEDEALALEIWVGLLSAPIRLEFSSIEALQSHVRVRADIARAAEKTALAFKTEAAERPQAYWLDKEDVGFLLQPGVDLIDALVAATQPERTGKLYDFSCYRATEYVILLGIAQEARRSQPDLHAQLESSSRQICIKSGLFHEVFLTEYGSVEQALPMRYYVPGDRVWFKNPDEPSSNAKGYEGSWVIYMGQGLFSNFWKRDRPFTLDEKCLEIFHWRDGAYQDADAVVQMNEEIVERAVAKTQADPERTRAVLRRMQQYRDPAGVYAQGGCIDSSREFPRQLSAIRIPQTPAP